MIEINLIANKKSFKMPVILGIDFAEINYRYLILAIIVHFSLEIMFEDRWKEEVVAANAKIIKINKVYNKLKMEMKPYRNLKRKLDAFNLQVEKLKERSKQVDNIIKIKNSPKYLLEGIARNIPDDVWFDILTIDTANNISIKGSAISYKSIGNFIITSNDTGFFGRSLNLNDSKTIEITHDGQKVRVQSYIIKGKVQSYNPWNGQ